MTRWVDRETYENEQTAEQAGGLIGLILLLIGSFFWLLYQGFKRPLAFAVYLGLLCLVLIPLSHVMSTTQNGFLQIGLAIVTFGALLAAFIGSRGPILAIEMLEARAMVWTYNKSVALGMALYWGLMLLSAVIGAALARMIGQFANQAFDLGVSANLYYAGGFILCPIFRIVSHPLAELVDQLGRPRPQAPDGADI